MTIAAPPAITPTRPRDYVWPDVGSGVVIARRGERVRIGVDDADDPAVKRAVDDLARDLALMCGAQPEIGAPSAGATIVVGTIGQSEAIDEAIRSKRLDVSELENNGVLRWEGFVVALHDDVLYLAGADRRGTVYAVYDFAEAMGVSPWHWWGDVPIRPRETIELDPETRVVDWPSVQHRGIFLNDEEELFHWARTHTPDGTIGPVAYRRIFELILRLKGNYLWAAMHVGAFNDDPENGRLANEMGVVIGTQHCDMLLRSNEHEFRPWVARRGEDVQYDYSLPGRNRELLREYWQESVAQNRDYEVTWSVGMRGVHDSGFVTSAIDDDPDLSEAQKLTARVRLLETVIHDQRALLSAELGAPAPEIPQLFIPYKEVLPLYDAGLEVPDDITMVWANDSFGHIRRFPNDAEQTRSGGHGLYYHSSYWSNYTTSYLATSSTPLALMKSELRKAWDRGIRRLWVDNIGGLKPLELEMEFFLRSGWEAGKETTTADVPAFVARWIDSKFSGHHGVRAGAIYAEYYQLNDQRKIEHLTADVFPQVGYGDEAGRRLEKLRRLYVETNSILESLPDDERDSFFELFAVKIHLAYLTNAEFYYADRSTVVHDQGKPAAADRYLAVSRSFAGAGRALIDFYNHRMAGGRWSGMFTPHEFPPPVMPLHAAGTPALTIGAPGLGVTVWGADRPEPTPELTFWANGTRQKWIEVHNTGAGNLGFTIDADPWIEIGEHSGSVASEVRIPVHVRAGTDAGHAGTIRVSSTETGEAVQVAVRLAGESGAPAGFRGAFEADGYVSLDPSRADRNEPGLTSRWEPVSHLGRYENSAMQVEPVDSHERGDGDTVLEFDVHLLTSGAHLLELHRLPTLNSTGRIRVGISIDDHPTTIVESATTDEYRGSWSQAIQDNIERLRITLPPLHAGIHRLRLHGIDDYVALSKLVVYTREPVSTNLGPDFSAHTDHPSHPAADPDPARTTTQDVDRDAARFYGAHPRDLPLPDQIYADRTFWEGATTFRIPRAALQTGGGATLDAARAHGHKNSVGALGSGAVRGTGGVIAFEAENAVANDSAAWITAAGDDPSTSWTHTQAETNAGTGLAMHIRPRGIRFDDPLSAPTLHYAVSVEQPGSYRAWLLVKFDDDKDDSVVIAVDGTPQPVDEQFSHGDLCAYGLRQRWLWAHISDLDLTEGQHTIALHARETGLRVDRVYLTLGDELPPVDENWAPSPRAPHPETRAS